VTGTRRRLSRALVVVAAATGLAACALWRPEPPVTRGGEERLTGREFLLPGQRESTVPQPYALYSYLLFGSAPTERARPRYLEAIRAYLDMLPPIQRLEQEGAHRRELNVTYLPVTDAAAVDAVLSAGADAPAVLLHHYNYAAARILLAKVPGGPHLDGPYLVSHRQPLSGVERLTGEYGWVDISGTPAGRTRLWVRIFLRETARHEYWAPGTTARVWTTILDELDKAGEGAPEVLKALVFWGAGR
jgi:hypothetical protein